MDSEFDSGCDSGRIFYCPKSSGYKYYPSHLGNVLLVLVILLEPEDTQMVCNKRLVWRRLILWVPSTIRWLMWLLLGRIFCGWGKHRGTLWLTCKNSSGLRHRRQYISGSPVNHFQARITSLPWVFFFEVSIEDILVAEKPKFQVVAQEESCDSDFLGLFSNIRAAWSFFQQKNTL